MSDQNQAPVRADADDTEGHVRYRGPADQPTVDDAEGHTFRRDDDENATEGYVRTRRDDDNDDVEGHNRGLG